MRVAACVVGVVGGLFGVYFGLLVVFGTALFGVLASAFGGAGTDATAPFYWGLTVLVLYTIGVAGGTVALARPGIAAILLALTAVGGLGATIAVGPSAMNVFPQPSRTPAPLFTLQPAPLFTSRPTIAPIGSLSPAAVIIVSFPFAGPVLLLVASALAGVAAASLRQARGASLSAPSALASRGELIATTPVTLHSGPSLTAVSSSRQSIDPGTTFDVLERYGEFVHVRGATFEGYLPARHIRLL